jgi:flagellar biosynthesis GTPase FlhF
MGSEAVILRTRTLRAREGGGAYVKKVEVTAAVDYEVSGDGKTPGSHPETAGSIDRWQHLEAEMQAIREALLSAEARALLSSEFYFNRVLQRHYLNFRNFGLRPEVIRELMGECHQEGTKEEISSVELLKDSLSRVLKRISLGREKARGREITSFVGPAGVGKTTTLAKLAALNVVKQGRKTALITFDTFRIAAVTQLQTYARILGIPLDVAVSQEDFQKAVRRRSDCDVILIDTPGRSPKDDQSIRELERLCGSRKDIHHCLVLSATSNYRNLLSAAENFSALPFKSYIFTKLDEIQDASSMVNFLISRKRPVSYFTTGQQVPDDIEAASKRKLASLMLADAKEMSEYRIGEVHGYGPSYGSQALS